MSSASAPHLASGLNGPGHYLHWGVIQISVANLVVIGLMLVLFALAVVLPFPGGSSVEEGETDDER
jgi:hypothetical protein